MYQICKNVIETGRYELSAMLRKLDTLWVQGSLSDEEKAELVELARANADPSMSVDFNARLETLERKVKVLEESGTPVPPSEEYPDFEPNHVYVKGDKVTFNGKRYECILNEYTDRTTWSPSDYPAYWRVVA